MNVRQNLYMRLNDLGCAKSAGLLEQPNINNNVEQSERPTERTTTIMAVTPNGITAITITTAIYAQFRWLQFDIGI